ncbi:fluoride efflux transporter FluC [Cellulomonas chengniuliangii]|uniref:Fluoride-specific ion channel FluC n=1 Tax=Cellulomonas chengniuliangii TaxID=2968084 RepID=A0ABY5L128_9CELL|nr:CrcB family protein [Cellulomonas chengniuliangii]MCC2307570.1 CrcB family protein [Cellulomonas chengniuliangii]MCC2318682.1 CrcB family protein [Cellulomonas chengniuliangii]UUI75660.1 CrcB family protein [Cellulomonas chengniuliangii]
MASDSGHTARTSRRTALRWSGLGLVMVGGILGVAAREGLTLAVPNVDDVPVVIPVVNLLSAFVLGYLYEGLARAAPGAALTGRLKLLIGTGFCGGLSTYSSLATDTAVLLDHDRAGIAVLYALGTVIVGALATLAGIALGARLHPHEPDEDELRHIEGHAQAAASPGGRS